MNNVNCHTDIISQGWVGKMPEIIQPYLFLMRLDRPIGTWLLLLPGLWAIALTHGGYDVMALFAIGALVMRGAGCVVNDLWDKDLDGRVERTRIRPLASGAVQPYQAVLFLFALLCVGLVILLQFNILTIVIGLVSVLFVAVYPYMKRITWWPQAFLGLTFNFGALMGWAAVTGELPWQAWALYAAGFFWTLGYDTIYAFQDREDDALVGIKSTARLFIDKMGINPKIPCGLFYVVHYMILMIVLLSLHAPNFLSLLFLIPAFHLVWQVLTMNPNNPQNALTRFRSNRDYGLLLFLVILFLY